MGEAHCPALERACIPKPAPYPGLELSGEKAD